jgi:hypothetical protein
MYCYGLAYLLYIRRSCLKIFVLASYVFMGRHCNYIKYFLQVYPVWKWFEKQDGIRSLQKDSTDPAPEFYNIYLERPKVPVNSK